jgi:hypothetical protein
MAEIAASGPRLLKVFAKPGSKAELASSLQGPGGFHGSVRVGQMRIYYSVGVFSEGAAAS